MKKHLLLALLLLEYMLNAQRSIDRHSLGLGAGSLLSIHPVEFDDRSSLNFFGGGVYLDCGFLITPKWQMGILSSAERWRGEFNLGLTVPQGPDPAHSDTFNFIRRAYFLWNNDLYLRYTLGQSFGAMAGASIFSREVGIFESFRDEVKVYGNSSIQQRYFAYYMLGLYAHFNSFQIDLMYRNGDKRRSVHTISLRLMYRLTW